MKEHLEKLFKLMGGIPKDKLDHMVYGYILFLMVGIIIPSDIIPLLIVAFLAALKEGYGILNPDIHSAEGKDWLATISLPVLTWLVG